jgi:ketosteroid isomerase-like protein
MAEDENQATVERLLAGINAGDISVMDDVFADDAQMDWPASMERVNGAENRRAVYSRTPVLPKITLRRVYGSGDLIVAEGLFDYRGDEYVGVLIFEFTEGKIARQTGYWAKPAPGPQWRSQWVEKLETPA